MGIFVFGSLFGVNEVVIFIVVMGIVVNVMFDLFVIIIVIVGELFKK